MILSRQNSQKDARVMIEGISFQCEIKKAFKERWITALPFGLNFSTYIREKTVFVCAICECMRDEISRLSL